MFIEGLRVPGLQIVIIRIQDMRHDWKSASFSFRLKFIIFYWFLVASFFCFLGGLAKTIGYKINYLRAAMSASLPELRKSCYMYYRDTDDYYDILSLCDRALPLGASVRLVVPKTSKRKSGFLEGKGRYFLYPRNFGDNEQEADYVLIYAVEDFKIPHPYRLCKVFGKDKYLLARDSCPWSGE